ncbi:hypothetical protein JCM18918_2704 [Cutibacterium acnes JCM 18918]|nr:hypothetical protein JCM18918_2704 [Cutibacterium acnes JCM 18918]
MVNSWLTTALAERCDSWSCVVKHRVKSGLDGGVLCRTAACRVKIVYLDVI